MVREASVIDPEAQNFRALDGAAIIGRSAPANDEAKTSAEKKLFEHWSLLYRATVGQYEPNEWRRSLRMLGWGPWLKLALLPLQDELVTKDGGLAHRRPGPSPPTPTSGTWKSADV
jgi:hypothetical protein